MGMDLLGNHLHHHGGDWQCLSINTENLRRSSDPVGFAERRENSLDIGVRIA